MRKEVADIYGVNVAIPRYLWFTVDLDGKHGPHESRLTPTAAGLAVGGKVAPLESRGPWYVDTNHTEGAGELLILAALRTKWFMKKVGFDPTDGFPADPNFRDCTIKVELEFKEIPADGESIAGGQLVFWFQADLPQRVRGGGERIANYALVDRRLTFEKQVKESIRLPSAMGDWRCMGRNQSDVGGEKYSCATGQDEFDGLLSGPKQDFGFLLFLPGRAVWSNPKAPPGWGTGALSKSSFHLTHLSFHR